MIWPRFRLETEHPIAAQSKDHLYPKGTKMAFSCPELLDDLAVYFGRPYSLLDLGCAGGGFVLDAIERGNAAVGIDGSDYSLTTRRPEALAHPSERGVGEDNWRRLGGSNLFTADVTKPFELKRDGKRVQFDVVTAWELLEHIPKPDLLPLMDNIGSYLAPGGLFCASIATCHDTFQTPGGIDMHETVEPEEWWRDFLSEWFEPVEPCPITHWMMQATRPGSVWLCMRLRR